MKHDFIDENAREQLSALLDGELDNDDSARFLQRRLQHDDALVGQLVRWQLAGDVLRKNARPGGEGDLANRVRAAIEREQAQADTKPKRRRGWMVWGGGGLAAVAALGIAALNLPGTVDPVPAAKAVVSVPHAPVVGAPAIAASTEAKNTKRPIAEASESVQHRVASVAPHHRQRDLAADVSSRVHADPQEAPSVAPERVATVAAATPLKSKVSRNPFTMQAAAPQSELAWPKAVLPGFNSGLNAGFRSDGNAGNPFVPHRPYEDPLPDH